MNRILIVLVTIFVAGKAFATVKNSLYGNFHLAHSWASTEKNTGVETSTRSWDNMASRLGFKGESSNDHLTTMYHMQLGANNDATSTSGFTSRFFYAGIKSDLVGTFKYGLMSNAYKMAGLKVDPFYDTPAGFNPATGTPKSGATYGLSSLTNGFTKNHFAFHSNNYFGVTVNLGFTENSDAATGSHSDMNYGLTWSGHGVTAGVQAWAADSLSQTTLAKDDTATRLYASYKHEKFSVGVSSETISDDSSSASAGAHLYVAGTYNICKKSHVSLSHGTVKEDTAFTTGATDGSTSNLGYFHDITDETNAYIIYSAAAYDDTDQTKGSSVSIGFKHNFSADL